jgi:pyruvate/2-oxoglutarate dehydrogenase complex dihydrolipoamide dehydrogenase (E3) component
VIWNPITSFRSIALFDIRLKWRKHDPRHEPISAEQEISMTEKFDAIVIGTGQSGPSLAERMVREGMRVAVIERGRFGGTCVNTGCIPTKTLVASAYVAHMARRAAEYGITTGPVSVDMKKVKARKDKIVAKSQNGVANWMDGLKNAKVFRGHGRFEGPISLV